MNRQEIEGAAEKAKGKVKEVFGKTTQNPTTVARGKEEQAAGEVKKQAGNIREGDSQQI